MKLAHLADLHLGFRQFDRQTPRGTNQREADVAEVFRRAVDDLLEQFREFHRSPDQSSRAKLRQAYDLLLLKVLALLQDGDPGLARDVSSSREALWSILVDPDKFKNL